MCKWKVLLLDGLLTLGGGDGGRLERGRMWATGPRLSIPDDEGGGSGGDRRRPSGDRDAVGLRRSDEEDEPPLGSGGERGRPPWPG